jgi:PAS domain S-box-containing protein
MRNRFPLATAAALALAALLSSLLLLELWRSHQRELDGVRDSTRQRVVILDSELQGIAQRIALALRSVELDSSAFSAAGAARLDSLLPELPAGSTLRVIDSAGRERSSAGPSPRLPESGPARAKAWAAEAPPHALLIEGPLQVPGGTWLVTYSQALRTADGQWGLAQCIVPVSAFQALLERHARHEQDSFTILSADLRLIARTPPGALAAGDPLRSARFDAEIARSPDAGDIRAVSVSDGKERLYSYKRVAGGQLYLIAGVGLDHGLADWRATAFLYSTSALFILFGALGTSLWSLRRLGAHQRKMEDRYRELLRTATDGVHIVDESGRLVEASDSFLRMLGREPADALTLHVGDWDRNVSPEDLVFLFRQDLANVHTFEATHHRADGGSYDAEVQVHIIELEGQRLCYCSARDITERKRQERTQQRSRAELEELVVQRTEALHEANARLAINQFAMDEVGIGIHWVRETDGRFLYVNRFAAQLLDYEPAELMQLSVPEIDPNFEGLDFAHVTANLRAQGGQFETANRSRSGELVPIQVTVNFRAGENGQPGFFVSFVRDDRRRKEIDTQLRRAKEAAERASVAKGEFIANMSHEIRTPLNAILGMAQLMRLESLPPEQSSRLEHIETAGQHLLEIINGVLDLASVESAGIQLKEEPFELDELVRRTLAMVALRAEQKALELVVDNQAGHLKVLGDRTRLTQALLNYLQNAVKFTDSGRICLRASIEADDGSVAVVRFAVQDTGIGIEPEALERLFAPFEQVDTSIDRRFGGTGLGLAITRRFAALMGGTSGVSSMPRVGSEFWFTCRLRHAAPPSDGQFRTQDATFEDIASRLAGHRVLVVDDDMVNQLITVSMLEHVRIRTATASDGEEALGMLVTEAFDLVLMDVQMHRLDGLSATRRLRERDPRIPVIGISATAFHEDRLRCLEAGMNDFVGKPIEMRVLYRALLRHLKPLAPEVPKPAS